MPNWVYCTVNVSGPAEDMAAFYKKAARGKRFYLEGHSIQDWGAFTDIQLESLMQEAMSLQDSSGRNDFSFHSLYPVPPGVQVMPYDPNVFSDLINSNPTVAAFCQKHEVDMCAYDWEVQHWGAKWGDCNTIINSLDEEYLSLTFETAWNAPHEFWKKVSADFPTLMITMSYTEEGGHFEGEALYEGGEARIEDWVPSTKEGDEDDF